MSSSEQDNGAARRAADVRILAEILRDTTGTEIEDITPETHLLDDLHISSLSLIETTVRAEEALGVQLEDEHVLSFNTVGDFLDHVDGIRMTNARQNGEK
ncbi:phosphopantetheine-binding protein [Corynebacterium uropygiale]|uniref:Phosphopantetheine-binding protein n=1 Tax=Corynebacterium uropygiale TaxID=1775911 RepID=A0A9X1QPT4_9CORY|nr:phosphopantetheine-binding protein [Corynebacterium uropygiale]MCF4006212.1 phosphopantetheine-binding protein [Corynebacterium uropygiale]